MNTVTPQWPSAASAQELSEMLDKLGKRMTSPTELSVVVGAAQKLREQARSFAEAVKDRDHWMRMTGKARGRLDEIAAGPEEGETETDARVLRKANHALAIELHDAREYAEQLKRDAERYRFIRQHASPDRESDGQIVWHIGLPDDMEPEHVGWIPRSLDDATDAALAKNPASRAEKVCEVCGGRASACRVLGHRPENDRPEWNGTLAKNPNPSGQFAAEPSPAKAGTPDPAVTNEDSGPVGLGPQSEAFPEKLPLDVECGLHKFTAGCDTMLLLDYLRRVPAGAW